MAGLSCGIIGLPNVGKSTLFNALTANLADASNYPFCTIDPNIGVVEVDDPRLRVLAELSSSQKIVYAAMQFVDIAGLVAGAAKGEGLGNKFLSHIRDVDAIVHVVRCFESSDIAHVAGKVDPLADIEVINLELCLADLQMTQNALGKVERQVKANKELIKTFEALKKVQEHLDKNLPVRLLELDKEEKRSLKGYPFLTAKKVLYVPNVAEDDLPEMENEYVQEVRNYARTEGNATLPICAQLEQEIAQLAPAERVDFLQSVGLEESGLQRLVKRSFRMLGLITFLTTGELESRAWTIKEGMTAVEAAGQIHTDIQKGFIRAEVITYEDFITHKGRIGAREAGKMRSEGRDYVVKDGDVVLFLHN